MSSFCVSFFFFVVVSDLTVDVRSACTIVHVVVLECLRGCGPLCHGWGA